MEAPRVSRPCCVCGSDCGLTPPSRAAGGRFLCVRCSAGGARPPIHRVQEPPADDGPIPIEGMSAELLNNLARAIESPPADPAVYPGEILSTARRVEKCPSCGHDMTNVPGSRCPRCGKLGRPKSAQARIAAANDQGYARERRARNIRTAIYYAAGLVTIGAVRLAQGAPELLWIDGRYLLIGGPIAMAVYVLCCLLFIGFDQPTWLNLLRLGAVHVMIDAIIAVIVSLPMSGCMTLIIAPAVAIVAYVMLLKRELDLEQLDAGLVAILSGAAAFGGVVISYYV